MSKIMERLLFSLTNIKKHITLYKYSYKKRCCKTCILAIISVDKGTIENITPYTAL